MIAAALIALSDAGWAFLGLLVVQLFAFATLLYRQGRARESIEQINTAVNHQGNDEHGQPKPTLISRMISVEDAVADVIVHRAWERRAFEKIAEHVGVRLPTYPTHKIRHHEDDEGVD